MYLQSFLRPYANAIPDSASYWSLNYSLIHKPWNLSNNSESNWALDKLRTSLITNVSTVRGNGGWTLNIVTFAWHKNAWFDTKMHCSTQTNALPACISCHCLYLPLPLLWEIIFPLYSNNLLLRTHAEMKTKLHWYSNIFDTIMQCEM